MTKATTRSLVAAAVLALAASLSACSGGSDGDTPEASAGNTANNQSTITDDANELGIENPKNAAAVDVCSLLPDEAAAKLGVGSKGRKEPNELYPSRSPACVWQNADGSFQVSLVVKDGRSIRTYYKNRDKFVDFKRLTIAGYPAVRANTTQPKIGCKIFLATNANQVVQSFPAVPADMRDTVRPCDVAKRALKLSVSSWPAAK